MDSTFKERQREIVNIPKGIFNERKSGMNFNFPDTPPQTPEQYWPPPQLFDYEKDFPSLSRQPVEPRKLSFFF